jgi:hypothetical protein
MATTKTTQEPTEEGEVQQQITQTKKKTRPAVSDPKAINRQQVKRLRIKEQQAPFLAKKQEDLKKRIEIGTTKLRRAESELTQVEAALSDEPLPEPKNKKRKTEDGEQQPAKKKVKKVKAASEEPASQEPDSKATSEEEEAKTTSEETSEDSEN